MVRCRVTISSCVQPYFKRYAHWLNRVEALKDGMVEPDNLGVFCGTNFLDFPRFWEGRDQRSINQRKRSEHSVRCLYIFTVDVKVEERGGYGSHTLTAIFAHGYLDTALSSRQTLLELSLYNSHIIFNSFFL